ncbi:MAG: NUDIX domain-containing protein [candidate division Zixibacteria bacterium]|nr:NUDIX domain-containing protein [candidate division Zixibacteria bacterium]
MQNEILDIFDDNYEPIGTMRSSEVHLHGQWHRVFHCWLLNASDKTILYQRRAATKRLYPGKMDVSFAGHCVASESVTDALVREGKEELGIILDPAKLYPLGVRRDSFCSSNMMNREFQHVFFTEVEHPLEQLFPNPDEVQEVFFLRPHDVLHVLLESSKSECVSWNGSRHTPIIVDRNDFITSVDNYHIKIALMANRFFEKDKLLLI